MALVREVVAVLHNLLSSEQGISQSWAAGSEAAESGVPRVASDQISTNNIPASLLSQQSAIRYPRFQVYCDRVENQMREKFNRFSGTAHLTIEIHHSGEKWEGVSSSLGLYIQSVTDVIESHRGELGDGMHLPGKYIVEVDSPKAGGRGFLQTARVRVPVEVIRP